MPFCSKIIEVFESVAYKKLKNPGKAVGQEHELYFKLSAFESLQVYLELAQN